MIVERVFQDGFGNTVHVRAEIDEGALLDREIRHLADKARTAVSGRATSAHGVLKVTVLSDSAKGTGVAPTP